MDAPRVAPGEAITAAWANTLAAAVDAAARASPGAGLHRDAGTILIAGLGRAYSLDALITAVHGPTNPGEPTLPSALTYTAEVLGRGGTIMEAAVGELIGRPHTHDRGGDRLKLIPARVGDPCRLWRMPDGRTLLELITEELYVEGPCDP